MDEGLDPECPAARALYTAQRDQATLLGSGSGSQLGSIVRQTHDRQVLAHTGGCARCSSYRNARCDACGFDVRYARHGWRCAHGAPTWREWLPWNWRPRHAPEHPPRATPGARPAAPPAATAAGRATASSVPPRRSVAPPAAKPHTSPLAHAYAALGVTGASTPEQVRAAFRERAQQYHPDKVGHMAPEFREVAERKMKDINEAYARIKRTW